MVKVYDSFRLAARLRELGYSSTDQNRVMNVADFMEDVAAFTVRAGYFCERVERAENEQDVSDAIGEFGPDMQHLAYHAALCGLLDVAVLEEQVAGR